MAECVFDNPFIMRRQMWYEKHLLIEASMEALYAILPDTGHVVGRRERGFYYLKSLGEWKNGEVRGSLDALPDDLRLDLEKWKQ